jgi:glycosyltransferase involved in cell wall biosynthesis
MRISVVIPCRNEAAHLPDLLRALLDQQLQPDEVVVVDNGSVDGSQEIVRAFQRAHHDREVRLVACESLGAAAAMNAGIEAAAGDIIVRLDGHCHPYPDYIRRAVTHLADARVGVVGGVWRVAPGGATMVARAIAAALGSPLATGGADYRHPDANAEARAVDTVPFGCYRKTLWRDLGGYDVQRTVNEDYVFNYKTRQSGRVVLLDPKIQSRYFARDTFARLTRQYFRYGWVKAAMLWQYPASVRVRQLLPAGLFAGLVAGAVLSVAVPPLRPLIATAMVAYLALLAVGGVLVARTSGAWSAVPFYVMAFAAIQVSWGAGAVFHAARLVVTRPPRDAAAAVHVGR